MIISIVGKRERTIVILPERASQSPVIGFKALSSCLPDKGYGMGGKPDTDRISGNFTKELHYCLKNIRYERYILAAYSISGIYGLYYANKYPNEEERFIGIDAFVPQ